MLGKVMSKSEFVVYNACKEMVRTVESLASKIGVDAVEGSIISESNGAAFVSFMSTLNGNTKYAMHKLDVEFNQAMANVEKMITIFNDPSKWEK